MILAWLVHLGQEKRNELLVQPASVAGSLDAGHLLARGSHGGLCKKTRRLHAEMSVAAAPVAALVLMAPGPFVSGSRHRMRQEQGPTTLRPGGGMVHLLLSGRNAAGVL
jgi:hypothetical protein